MYKSMKNWRSEKNIRVCIHVHTLSACTVKLTASLTCLGNVSVCPMGASWVYFRSMLKCIHMYLGLQFRMHKCGANNNRGVVGGGGGSGRNTLTNHMLSCHLKTIFTFKSSNKHTRQSVTCTYGIGTQNFERAPPKYRHVNMIQMLSEERTRYNNPAPQGRLCNSLPH